MAGTEDIAEKVADLLFDQGTRAMNFGFDTGKSLVKGAGVLTQKGLEALVEKVKKDKDLQKILDLEGEITPAQMTELVSRLGLRSSSIRVAQSDAKEFEALLRQNGVLYAKMDIKDDDAKMFSFLNRDKERIQNVATVLEASRGMVTEVRPDLYFNSLAPENIRLVDGLDRTEMELFRHYARYEGLLFTAIKRSDKYALVYENKDEEKARRALLHVGWDLTGYNGARNREQVEYRLQGRNSISISAEEGQRELYIVSKNHPDHYINISSEDFSVYKAGKKVNTVSRTSPDFYTKCMAAADGLENGVVLTEDRFRPDMTREELEPFRTIDLHMAEYEDMVEIDRQNNLINLVAMKSGMDNEGNATWGLWDPSVSYSEFAGYEFIMDEEEREAREAEFEHFKKAAYYSEDHFISQDVKLDEKNVDYIIQKAEEKRKAQTQAGQSRSVQQKETARDDDKEFF